jgi:NitT/TauT family transport system substrate-binding protein
VWEWASLSYENIAILLPSPSEIVKTAYQHGHLIFHHACSTFLEMTTSLILSVLFSFAIGWSMAAIPRAATLFQTFFVLVQSLPGFCLAPLLVLWCGWGYAAIIIPTALMMIFPLSINIWKGLKAAPAPLSEYFFLQHATSWQRLWKLQIPFALPFYFSGIRIAIAISGLGTIAGEWGGGQEGLGILMLQARENMDTSLTFAAIFAVVLMNFGMYALVILFERICVVKRWTALYPLLILLMCSSCTKKKEDPHHIHLVLDWTPSPHHVPLYYGISKGFFSEEGLTIHIFQPGQLDPLQLVAASQADICISYLPRVIRAATKTSNLLLVGTLVQQPLNGILTRRDKIETTSDLEGKILGYCGNKNGSQTLVRLLQNNHIHPKNLLHVRADLVKNILTQTIDAVHGACRTIEPFALESAHCPATFIGVTELGMPTYHEFVFVSSKNSIFRNSAFVKKFQTALAKAVTESQSHPKEAYLAYLAAIPEKTVSCSSWEERAWDMTATTLSSNQKIPREEIHKLAAWLIEQQLMSDLPDLEGLGSQVY